MIPALALLKTRTGQIVAGVVVVLIIFGVWLHFHDRGVLEKHEENVEAKAAPARAKADEQRGRDTATIDAQTKEVKDATASLPPARTSYRQCVRARNIRMQQNPTARPPEPCRPDPGSGAANP
ncbi:hypothetical protein ABIC65_001109 [Sphingomonas trueperi]|uniref:hypothetical protein n=1 Tax=Sphingomonas trueperi TaxID=53317 RepID=UPI003398150B